MNILSCRIIMKSSPQLFFFTLFFIFTIVAHANLNSGNNLNPNSKIIHVGESDNIQNAFDELLTLPDTIQNAYIMLDPGIHRVQNTIMLNSSHTKKVEEKIYVQSSEKNARTIISGGVKINSTWEKVLSSKYTTTTLWKATLPSNMNLSISSRLQAWRGETRLQVAKSPLYQYNNVTSKSLNYANGQILSKYYDQNNVLLVMYESWTASLHRIANIDPLNSSLSFQTAFNSQWANQASGRRYYVMNAKELLDEVGEFYIDVLTEEIYLVLNATENPNDDGNDVTIGQHVTLLNIQGENSNLIVKNIHFNGIEFAHTSVETMLCLSTSCDGQSASFLTTALFHTRFSKNIIIDNCVFRNTGGYAVWFDRGSIDNILSNNNLIDLGAGAVRIGEPAVNVDLADGNKIINNVMNNGGQVYQMGAGVLCQNSKNILISHNEIAYFRYTGVSTGWTWGFGKTIVSNITTSFNHIHHIGLGYLSDMGCVYTLGHQPNSTIKNNLCHDVQSYNYGGWGYYTDEGSRDEIFTNNIALRTKCAGHHQHYGTDNILENNIYYNVNIGDVITPGRRTIIMQNCDTSIRSSQHNRNINTCHPNKEPTKNCCCFPGCDQGKCSSFTFRRNIIYQPEQYNKTFIGTTVSFGLDNFTFNSNLYWINGTEATPSEKLWNATASKGWSDGYDFKTWKTIGDKDDGSITEDPKLDVTTFQFAKDSPALLKIGFEPIDISQIGPTISTTTSSKLSLLYKKKMMGEAVYEKLVEEEMIRLS